MSFNRKLIVIFAYAALFLGSPLLNLLGYTYKTDYGSALFKIHPATYALLIVVLYCFISNNINYLFQGKVLEMKFLVLILFLIFSFYIRSTTNGLSFVVDTVTDPVIFLILLPRDSGTLKKMLLTAVYSFFIINCTMAVIEKIGAFNLFPVKGINVFGYRASALQGHPLNNALIIATIMSFIYLYEYNKRKKRLLILLGYIGLICFSTRGALYVSTFAFFAHQVGMYFKPSNLMFLRNTEDKSRFLLNALYILTAVGLSLYLIFETKFGARLTDRSLFYDDSIAVRVDLWSMFDRVTFSDLLFGLNTKMISDVMYNSDINIIENFWMIWLFRFGVIFMICMLFLYIAIFQKHTRQMFFLDKYYLAFVFVAVASTNNSLGTNTTALSVFFICLVAFSANIIPHSRKINVIKQKGMA